MGTTMTRLSGGASSSCKSSEASSPSSQKAPAPGTGTRQGPGRWCMLQTGEFDKAFESRALSPVMQAISASIPADSVWTDPERPARGGITSMSYLHATLLIRLNEADHIDALRAVTAQTSPFVLTVSDVYVSKVKRLSTEFGYDIYSLGIAYQSEQVVQFKEEWTARVGVATGHTPSPPRASSPSDESTDSGALAEKHAIWLEEMQQIHDPYKGAGHSSLVYFRESGLEAAEALRVELVDKYVNITKDGSQSVNIPVGKIGVKHPDDADVEWIHMSLRD